MLGEIRSKRNRRQVFRLAAIPQKEDFVAELRLDRQGSDELRELLADTGHGGHLDELLDSPFRPKRRLRSRTRFSDGSFPVFYSSLDPATADVEIRYWFPRYSGRPWSPRTAYYRRFSCTFDGIEKDLRDKIADWPDLIHDSDYSFCNQLGAEAKRLEIGGLVTWSARCEGANLPVFMRQAVSNPELEDAVAMTYHPDTGKVAVVSHSGTPRVRPPAIERE